MTPEQLEGLAQVLNGVIHHLDLQKRKWNEQNHRPEKWLAIAGEEYGEACKAWLEAKPEEYREELLGLAAVCVHAVDCLDRHQAKLRQSEPEAQGPIENGIQQNGPTTPPCDGPWEHGIQRK